MKSKLVLSILSVCFAVSLYGQKSITLQPFSVLQASGNVEVELMQTNTYEATYKMIEGDDKDLEISVDKSGVLKIKIKAVKFLSSKAKAKVKLKCGQLNEIKASAGAYVHAQQAITLTTCKIDGSSGGSLDLQLKAKTLDIDASSGSRITLMGKTTNIKVDVSSGANVEAERLESQTAVVDASSGAKAQVYATQSLNAHTTSGGNISYRGNPEELIVDKGKFAGGSIERM